MIRVLEDRLVNQIAAGEVVERPASVVKELVENALDAGARHLRVTLKDGGRDLVQVEDDGHGMDRQDAMLCVERHATSKIATSEDLARIRTLGFRGEALPSIAAVSRFELTTRRQGEETGTRVVIDGGRMTDVRDAGCPVGTRVTVRSLFYNLPARRKFLRTEATELQHCQDAVLRELLIRPGVGVDLFHDGRPLVRAAAEGDAAARAAALLGREGEQLVAVRFDDEAGGGMQVSGLLSPPGVHHATTRGSLWLYVNGRPVRDPLMRRAVVDAFRGLVPKGRFPTVILDLRMPVEEVDVNVHPAKAEVRFRDGREVARALVEGLRVGMERQGIRPEALTPPRGVPRPPPGPGEGQPALPGFAPPALEPPRASGEGRAARLLARAPLAGDRATPPWTFHPGERGGASGGPPDPSGSRGADRDPRGGLAPGGLAPGGLAPGGLAPGGLDPGGLDPGDLGDAPPPPPAPPEGAVAGAWVGAPRATELRVVGQAADRWLVCTLGEELLLVDQHRAHAAALARRLEDEHASLPLLAPVLVEADPAAVAAVDRAQPLLTALGVELDTFGGDTLRLRALPGLLRPAAPRQLALDLARALVAGADADALRRLLARAGAVAPGTRLSPYEQRQLLEGVDPLAPGVAVRLSADELARRLERA